MMATIYEKADQVIVWPGHAEDGDNFKDLSYPLECGLMHGKLEKRRLSVVC
jgi:hypothetical protein